MIFSRITLILVWVLLNCSLLSCVPLKRPVKLQSTSSASITKSAFQPKLPLSVKERTKNVRNAAWRAGVNGSFAACLQVIALMWIRTIISYQYRYGVSFKTASRELFRQGGVARFYKGVSYALVQGPLTKFGVMAAHEGSKALAVHQKLQAETNGEVVNAVHSPVFSSLIVTGLSVLWRVLLMPLETCKTVLQVQGLAGFHALMNLVVAQGHLHLLYEGTLATIAISVLAYYPWFYVHDRLDSRLPKPRRVRFVVMRSALIGFAATVVSDCCSNFLRVVKTIKQTASSSVSLGGVSTVVRLSYGEALQKVYSEQGLAGLCGRGLLTRVIANGLQTILFTVVWKLLQIRAERKERDEREVELWSSEPN